MSAHVHIDDMQTDDVAAVAALEAAAFPARAMADAPSYEARLREELARPWTKLWIARAPDGSICGFLLAWHVVDEVHILNVASHIAHRRRGIGRALLQHATRYAAEKGVKQLLLEVRRTNVGAIRLYREIGFFAMGLRRDYYADHEDAIEMMLLLDPQTGAVLRRQDEVHLDDA